MMTRRTLALLMKTPPESTSGGEPLLVISHIASLHDPSFQELEAALAEAGASCRTEPRKQDFYAAIEWLAPAAIALYISKPFVDAFLKRAADDVANAAYPKIKLALTTFATKLLSRGRGQVLKIRGGHAEPEPNPTGLLSVHVQVSSVARYKFVLEDGLAVDQYKKQIEAALELVADQKPGVAGVERNPAHSETICIFDSETGLWTAVDPGVA